MNLLITTLGTSWQIVPELLGITNPEQFDFFSGSEEAVLFRKEHHILPVQECWIVTTEGQHDLNTLTAWADHWHIKLRVYVCQGVNTFLNQTELLHMRSLIYRAVFNGTQTAATGKLYLSLSGGRKTMSADMQEAGNLFGCDAMLHVVDKYGLPKGMKNDTLLADTCGKYAASFTPLIVAQNLKPSLVVSADYTQLYPKDFPLPIQHETIVSFAEDGSLANQIQERKERSSQLYANFYNSISRTADDRAWKKGNLFRELYFLHPDKLRQIKLYTLGKDRTKDMQIIQAFPKAELHSHLGGVLSPQEIICVAQEEAAYIPRANNPASAAFKQHIDTILSYKHDVCGLQKEIYSPYTDAQALRHVGITAYQNFGRFQGSALLQTRKTLTKAVELYAQKLKSDRVKYVELRCSPYNYTKLDLSLEDAVACIMDTLEQFSSDFEYRLICIINREKTLAEIDTIVRQIIELRNKNARFAQKFAAIDLAGNESKASPAELRKSFMPFLENCIHITIHAGETENAKSIWEAVYHLNADRIGHGLCLMEHKELLNSFISKKIGIELCPTSNDQIIGYNNKQDSYPLKAYLHAGLKVCLNTDDCGISDTSVSQEFIKASQLCSGLTLWDCIVLIRNSLSLAFCDFNTKTALMHNFEDEILKICDQVF